MMNAQQTVQTAQTLPSASTICQPAPLAEMNDLGTVAINSVSGHILEADGKKFVILKSNTGHGGTVVVGEDTLMKLLDRGVQAEVSGVFQRLELAQSVLVPQQALHQVWVTGSVFRLKLVVPQTFVVLHGLITELLQP